MKKTRLIKLISAVTSAVMLIGSTALASDMNGTKEIKCKVGDNLTVGTYADSAAKTQELINNRPNVNRQMEDMGRGLVAVKADNGIFVSWRWQGTESLEVQYNLYKNGVKLNAEPMKLTNYMDNAGKISDKYAVSAVVGGVEGEKCAEVSVWENGYLEFPVSRPASKTLANGEDGGEYTPGDASAADLDGDGEYEIVLKWNALVRDASKVGYTSECILDAYELDGTLMWRINMGPNIRSGEHDTQFMVADFDNDGKAEMAVRTADGTIAGDGTVIGNAQAKWYETHEGKNLDGPLFLTMFKGEDGTIIDSTDFYPQSKGTYEDGTEWGIDSWGDDYGNRSERYLGAILSLDGVTTSVVQARGYYDKTCIAAYSLKDGKIVTDWTFDSKLYNDFSPSASGQGYHNLSTADVDYDGKDELIYGNLVLDDDGKPMYSTGLGHGDSLHVGDLVPSRPGLEVYTCQEWRGAPYGFAMRDARTGEILYGLQTDTDNGRACTADIDPRYEGEEAWSAYGVLTAADGTVISTNYSMPANFAIYWDGDIGREIMDGNGVYKWSVAGEEVNAIFKAKGAHSINAAKATPCLQADIFGDWREELIFPADDCEHIRIYSTTTPTAYRIPTLMSDGQYRNAVGWQNDCYNQTTHLSYYLGYDTKTVPIPRIYTVGENGEKITNPDLASKKEWTIGELYFGDMIELVPNYATALVNGEKLRIDNDNPDVKPYINSDSRTMVPIRFIAENFGAEVDYDGNTRKITIETPTKCLSMTPDEKNYTVNMPAKPGDYAAGGVLSSMDTAPEIVNDRTFVPLRAVSEALGYDVQYKNGLVTVSKLNASHSDGDAAAIKAEIEASAIPKQKVTSYLEPTYGSKEGGGRIEATVSSTSNSTDGSAVTDYDLSTSWTCPAGGEIILDNVYWPGIPAVVIAFGDDKPHKFRIEYGNDGENWQIGIADRESDGKSGLYEKYYFGVPPYTRYVKYVSMDEYDTEISEFANARVE